MGEFQFVQIAPVNFPEFEIDIFYPFPENCVTLIFTHHFVFENAVLALKLQQA